MRESISELFAIARSARFTAYMQGVSVRLPTGEDVIVKVESTSKSIRPVGLRFSAFAYMTEVSVGSFRGIGFGEASTNLVALQKSIAEGVERAVYKALKGTSHGTENSNGWAAHISRERAFESAIDELVERDAVLVHWLRKVPLKEVASKAWPSRITRWVQSELRLSLKFNQLRILVSSQGYKPTITTVLLDEKGYGVISHASDRSIEHALDKALAETCRIAQIAMDGKCVETSARLASSASEIDKISPEDHAMFYAFHEPVPNWIFGEQIDWATARRNWNAGQKNFTKSVQEKLNAKFHQITNGPLVVGFATSDLIQNLYFGRTQDAQARGFINARRLREVKPEGEIYLLPHCVP